MSNLTSGPKKTPWSQATGIVGGVVGAAIGLYSGIILLIPLFATGLVFWAGVKIIKGEKKMILPAFSVNAGHFVLLASAMVLLGARAFSAVGADLVAYVVGLAWLFIKPSRGPLYLLGIYQLLSLGVNGYAFAEATIGSAAHKALLVHIIWRALALFLIFRLFIALKKRPEGGTGAGVS